MGKRIKKPRGGRRSHEPPAGRHGIDVVADVEARGPELERAVRDAKAALDPQQLEDMRGRLWSDVNARPYLRALVALGRAHLLRGAPADAVEPLFEAYRLDERAPLEAGLDAVAAALATFDFMRAEEALMDLTDADEPEPPELAWLWAAFALIAEEGADESLAAVTAAASHSPEVGEELVERFHAMERGQEEPPRTSLQRAATRVLWAIAAPNRPRFVKVVEQTLRLRGGR